MIVLIHDLKRQGLSISAIARKTGLDRRTVRKHLERGLEVPSRTPRAPRARLIEPYEAYLRQRIIVSPGLSGRRLLREIRDLGHTGGYTSVTDFLRRLRDDLPKRFEIRFETPPGRQAQAGFAEFTTCFAGEPGIRRKVSLFSYVLGNSRWLWGRFCLDQKQETALRCHIMAFEAAGGAPQEALCDRMKTAVQSEAEDGAITCNRSLAALLDHYGSAPRACRPYRAKTKGKVERPFRHIRQDFFLDRVFHNLDDLNAQFADWVSQIANSRLHGAADRVVSEAFAEEQLHLIALPDIPCNAVLVEERRVSHEGMVSVGVNLCSAPDTTRKREVEIRQYPREVHIFEDGVLVACHPVLEGRNQRRIDPGHRKSPPGRQACRQSPGRNAPMDIVITPRPLVFYDNVARRMASLETIR